MIDYIIYFKYRFEFSHILNQKKWSKLMSKKVKHGCNS
jgi:hypothetical protein